ncbi:hypothetical protein VFPFJ_09436 [Purpureocillium lilacinum]|uniref:Uncharacterized protein n=1 Tax=Purpureocillium lilacinum TaxID=33203 RepID=A0A179GDA1_PURLI|nr:hypothetical protein VFPFJ_09436 [Purpureocillium lilacinum]OAQ75353.1 hypothetical protein VFPBJ_09328 [Purpureocillium lilacinum]OAQ80982.1 hypothetical protein VFPFJ_09436 [Purpureocillium lilacinum]
MGYSWHQITIVSPTRVSLQVRPGILSHDARLLQGQDPDPRTLALPFSATKRCKRQDAQQTEGIEHPVLRITIMRRMAFSHRPLLTPTARSG